MTSAHHSRSRQIVKIGFEPTEVQKPDPNTKTLANDACSVGKKLFTLPPEKQEI
jgi:hypothetical protein